MPTGSQPPVLDTGVIILVRRVRALKQLLEFPNRGHDEH